MSGSRVDRIYRSLLLSKYFVKGWGSPADIKRLLKFGKYVRDRSEIVKLVPEDYKVTIVKERVRGNIRLVEGEFRTPLDLHLPELLPKEVKTSRFQMISHVDWREEDYRPVCIQMAATGDQLYWRRRAVLAQPILEKAGIASIMMQNPFYSKRKPPNQTRSILNNVLDIFVMGGCLMLEGMVLHSWCKRQGWGPIGYTGFSMGGHMASLAATAIPEPVVLVPCLSWSTASGVFTKGVMSKAIDWNMLQCQYDAEEIFKVEIRNMVLSLSEDAFRAGRRFMKKYAEKELKKSAEKKMKKKFEEITKPAPLVKKKKPRGIKQWYQDIVQWIPKLLKKYKKRKHSYESKYAFLKKLNIFSKDGSVDLEELEAFHFMKGIMDECTHLGNFSKPVDTSLVIAVCAEDDEYVPRKGVSHLKDIWPEAEVRYVPGGHVQAFLFSQNDFQRAVMDAFDRYKVKYKN